MDKTMAQVAKDVTKLRKSTGVTPLEIAILAGDPCRTFLMHLEQGRKTQLNLVKLYGVLQILFERAGLLPSTADAAATIRAQLAQIQACGAAIDAQLSQVPQTIRVGINPATCPCGAQGRQPNDTA